MIELKKKKKETDSEVIGRKGQQGDREKGTVK